MKRVFLVHGYTGFPENHWFPWLKKQLEEKGFAVESLKMPNPKHPKKDEWVSKLKESVGSTDENTYLVGHSLGCIAIVRYLEQLPENAKVGGCVFVAGFSKGLKFPELTPFYTPEPDMEKVKKHTDKFVTIFSTDDDMVPLEIGKKFQQQLGAELIIEENKGHFCKNEGVTELPSVLNAVVEMAGH